MTEYSLSGFNQASAASLRARSARFTTKLADLALLCANRYRMIHARRRWLYLEQLRALLTTPGLPT